jgi:molybdate transport system substrate-binding protein
MLGITAAVALTGCGGRTDPGDARAPVWVFVAASTKEAVEELAAAFTTETGVEVKVNPDDSSKLATQIANDAPAHLFLSANERWADFVKEQGFAHAARPLLGNSWSWWSRKATPPG